MAESYVLDNLGRKTQVTKQGQTLTSTFDALGRQASETSSLGTVGWQYDKAGRRKRLTWPDGVYVDYHWNLSGGMTGIIDASGVWIAQFAYDDRGRRTLLTRGGGVLNTAYGYDAQGRLSSLSLEASGTAYDASRTFTRNAVGQITSRTNSNSLYAYPAAASASTLSYGAANSLNQITTAGPLTASYDGRGNFDTEAAGGSPVNDYDFDLENRMTWASGVTLAYDPANRLREVVGTATTRFLYDGPNLIAEYNQSGVLLRRHYHGPGPDEPLGMDDYNGRNFLAVDERGSVLIALNRFGPLLGTQAYDEYGRALLTSGSYVGRFGYTGQAFVPELGLNYYKARFYSPQHGRFMSTDPTGYADGPNMYAYVGNDPVNMVDPDGLEGCPDAMKALCNGLSDYWEGVKRRNGEAAARQDREIQAGNDSTCRTLLCASSALAPELAPLRLLAIGRTTTAATGEVAATAEVAAARTGAQATAERAAAQGPRLARGKLREQVLDKGRQADGTVKCSYCGQPTATQSDHVVPYSRGGATRIENLEPACPSCNVDKGVKELWTEWLPPSWVRFWE